MNEKKIALGIGVTGLMFVALVAYLTAPDLVPQPPVVLLPASSVAAIASNSTIPSKQIAVTHAVTKTGSDCSTERLDSWRLISLEPGRYRQGGFAVLHNDHRGAITISETQTFDGNLLLEKVTSNTVELRCDHIAQTKILADSHSATDATAAPEMRTALPDPSNN